MSAAIIRKGLASDIPDLIELFDIANHGAVSAFWANPERPGTNWRELAREAMTTPQNALFFENFLVAYDSPSTVGMLNVIVTAPSAAPDFRDAPEYARPFLKLSSLCAGEIELRVMAVRDSHRGQGLARRLLDIAFDAAKSLGLGVYAIVHESNDRLLRHYQTRGLIERAREPVLTHPRFAASSCWVLMHAGSAALGSHHARDYQ